MKVIRQNLVDRFREELGEDVLDELRDATNRVRPEWLKERVDNFCRPRIEEMCARLGASAIRSAIGQ